MSEETKKPEKELTAQEKLNKALFVAIGNAQLDLAKGLVEKGMRRLETTSLHPFSISIPSILIKYFMNYNLIKN